MRQNAFALPRRPGWIFGEAKEGEGLEGKGRGEVNPTNKNFGYGLDCLIYIIKGDMSVSMFRMNDRPNGWADRDET